MTTLSAGTPIAPLALLGIQIMPKPNRDSSRSKPTAHPKHASESMTRSEQGPGVAVNEAELRPKAIHCCKHFSTTLLLDIAVLTVCAGLATAAWKRADDISDRIREEISKVMPSIDTARKEGAAEVYYLIGLEEARDRKYETAITKF